MLQLRHVSTEFRLRRPVVGLGWRFCRLAEQHSTGVPHSAESLQWFFNHLVIPPRFATFSRHFLNHLSL
jgi:hypothetical protein